MCEEVVEVAGRCLLKSGGDVRIGVESHADGRVPEALLHYLGVDTDLQHEAGVGMPGVVESYTR